ncbi:MAG: hypothetical protein IPG07_01395 [Crocinitomicaceae bacterium]|nr:hypothetical protein [Crocinitomicaceae bacterium]
MKSNGLFVEEFMVYWLKGLMGLLVDGLLLRVWSLFSRLLNTIAYLCMIGVGL